jgi:RimJ/RimL family protein N-acetyltransferase
MRFKDFGCESPFVKIYKDDISIRTTTYDDLEPISKLRSENKDHLSPWTSFPDVPSDSEEGYAFTIRYKDEIVGEVVLWYFTYKSCFISYWVDKNHCNQGIGTTAVSMATLYALDNYDVDSVKASIQPSNLVSIRLAEKLGFKSLGVSDYLRVQDGYEKHDLYAFER